MFLIKTFTVRQKDSCLGCALSLKCFQENGSGTAGRFLLAVYDGFTIPLKFNRKNLAANIWPLKMGLKIEYKFFRGIII